MNNIKSLLLLPLLAACASTSGRSYSEAAPIPKGMAQIIVYERPEMISVSRDVDINGATVCGLAPGTFFVRNAPPGSLTLSSSIWDMPGTSRLTLNAVAGHRYYVRRQFDTVKGMGFGAFGILGGLAAEGASNHGGPFIIESVDEASAQTELNSLTKNDCN